MINLSDIRIVLVNTKTPGNIGAAARAMKNMGITHLYLVQPQDFPHQKAIWRSAHAKEVVENATVCETLNDAVGDCHLAIGTSARDRYISSPNLTAAAAADKVVAVPDQQKVAIVFGREDSGLTNDELQQCHFHLDIPTSADYTSLNLAAAVQVVCYEIYTRHLLTPPTIKQPDRELADQQEVQGYLQHLQQTLLDLKFYDPAQPKQLLSRLRRLYMRANLDKIEVNILRGILTAVQNLIIKKG